jgi:HNH endonuclease
MLCSFSGCVNEARSLGLCPAHRAQQKRGEVLKTLQVQHHGLSEYDRFFKRVKVGKGDECWVWTGSQNNTHWHGQWRNAAGGIELTHRASWRLLKGAIPEGACVLHRCDNPVCVNPSHLFMGSQSDNAHDMWNKGRAKPKANLGASHGMSKVTEEIVLAIRASSESGVALAKKYGIRPTTVCDIRKRRTWDHVK